MQQLGLAEAAIQISPSTKRKDVTVDAWGQTPFEVQQFGMEAQISMTLIHYDEAVMEACVTESLGGGAGGITAFGQVPEAGTRMGGNNPTRFGAGNHYIGLNIASPVGNLPWRFYYTLLADNPFVFPLGTERSAVQLTWRAIAYTADPWQAGFASAGWTIWDRTLDT